MIFAIQTKPSSNQQLSCQGHPDSSVTTYMLHIEQARERKSRIWSHSVQSISTPLDEQIESAAEQDIISRIWRSRALQTLACGTAQSKNPAYCRHCQYISIGWPNHCAPRTRTVFNRSCSKRFNSSHWLFVDGQSLQSYQQAFKGVS